MGYNIYSLRGGEGGSYGRRSSETKEFYEAMEMTKEGMKMAKKGFEMVCELAEEMADQFGERRGGYGSREGYGSRGGYGNRGGYGRRDDEEYEDFSERRMRDGRGRFM